jgi:hypothetical protein
VLLVATAGFGAGTDRLGFNDINSLTRSVLPIAFANGNNAAAR